MVEFDDLYVLISTGIEVDFNNILSNTINMDSFIFYQGIIDIDSTNSSLIIEASENIVILGGRL